MERFENLLAKSDDKITLNSHNEDVLKYATEMCKILGLNDRITKTIKAAVLLHDIGKIRTDFQNILHDITTISHVYHHLDGWAALKSMLVDSPENNLILSTIYWHHSKPEMKGNPSFLCNADEILNLMSEADISLMKDYSIWVLKKHGINLVFRSPDDIPDLKTEFAPQYYVKGDNTLPLLCRSVLITADRLSSEFQNNPKCDFQEVLKNLDYREFWDIQIPNGTNLRFDSQQRVVNDIMNSNTVIVKAPAGYGKTFLGIQWIAKHEKKAIWVAPRNIVAETLYNGIIGDLKLANLSNVSVELILSSKRIKCNKENVGEFNADIIVTNIDNFLFPTVRNDVGDRQFSICSRLVIFDEYHELVQEHALFYGFVNLVKLRHKHTNSKTLLLSATPISIESNWDFGDKQTLVYPNKDEHLPAVHNKKYSLNIISGSFNEIVAEINKRNIKNSILFVNSISNSQILHHDTDTNLLIHSNFQKEDLDKIRNKIFKHHDKYSGDCEKLSLVSSPLMEVSADMSFENMYKCITSPESDIQGFGRCNRFGEYDGSCITFFNILNNQSENKTIDIRYNKNLCTTWTDTIKHMVHMKDKITLDELYVIYNAHNKLNQANIQAYVSANLNQSLECIMKMYPAKSNENDSIISEGGFRTNPKETLRGNSVNTVYYITKIYDTEKEFIEPMAEKIYVNEYHETIETHFHCDNTSLKSAIKAIAAVSKHYEYSRNIEKGKFEMADLAKYAWNKNTPFIATNWCYHPNYGVLKNKTIEKFQSHKGLEIVKL